MQAWLCENPTGVDSLQWKDLPTPQPKAGEVLIEKSVIMAQVSVYIRNGL